MAHTIMLYYIYINI